ncbi:MAG TPA: menaquinone biosynthesis decarboxylase, partial [Puia sp.]|nr:menaquinone biosynthesis decarboxylase [Puia sp.]
KNLDPASDIYFSQGPMDVLDHSCSKLGFGGKMCIDGSKKFEEELTDAKYSNLLDPPSLEDAISQALPKFPEIKSANTKLIKDEIPCLILSVKKNRSGHIKELHQSFCRSIKDVHSLKIILYVEHTVDPNGLATALWRFCNNLDPKRDHILFQESNNGSQYSCMGFDGTIKTSQFDGFKRDWPNIIVADDKTIRAIDEKWNELGLGEFIPSPSLKFKDQMYGEEAVAAVPA